MTFITIKYGNNQNVLFNPNCKTVVLLDDIKRRCNCNEDSILDVSDEKGEIKHLQDHGHENATKLLKGREILILVEVKTKTDTNEVTYIPLLKNMKKLYPQALERLSTIMNNETEEQAVLSSPRINTKQPKQRHVSQNAVTNLQTQTKNVKKISLENPRRRTKSDR